MDNNQKINCTVTSCKYNQDNKICSLEQIIITPKANCVSKNSDESMCSSYENVDQ